MSYTYQSADAAIFGRATTPPYLWTNNAPLFALQHLVNNKMARVKAKTIVWKQHKQTIACLQKMPQPQKKKNVSHNMDHIVVIASQTEHST